MYPHFNASKPPPPVQVSFAGASKNEQANYNYNTEKPPGGYSLGAISERTEEPEERMDDRHFDPSPYDNPQHPPSQQAQQEYVTQGYDDRTGIDRAEADRISGNVS